MNLGSILETMSKEESQSYFLNSYLSLYKNSIFIVEDILKDFTQNKDIFETKDIEKGEIAPTVLIERSKYNFLKNSYSQLSILLIHYEKLLMDLLNKLFVDLSRIILTKRKLPIVRTICKQI